MRTTLDIEDDVLQAAKELALREGTTAGQIISNLARRGLSVPTKVKMTSPSRGGVPLLPKRGEVVTLEHVRELMDREGI
jgi:hypothetical protein